MWISSEKKRLLVASGVCLCAHTVLLLVGFQPLQTRAVTLDTLSAPASASSMVLTLAADQRSGVNPTAETAAISEPSPTQAMATTAPEPIKKEAAKEEVARKEEVIPQKALPLKTPQVKKPTKPKVTPEKKADVQRTEQPEKSDIPQKTALARTQKRPTEKQQYAAQATTQGRQGAANSAAVNQTNTASPSLPTTLNSESKPRFRIPPTPPEYPTAARARRQEGTTLLDITLGVRGELLAVVLTRSSGSLLLDKAALKAVQKWQFLPKEINGVGIKHTVRIPIRFELT